MNEQQMNESFAEAMDMSVEEVTEALGTPAPELEAETEPVVEDAPTDEASETTEFEMGDEDAPAEEEEHSEEDDTTEEPGSPMDYAESTAIKAALAGDKLPQDLIEALSDDQLREYMDARSKRDEAFDRLRGKLNDTQTDDTDDEEAPATEPDNSPTKVDIKALAEEFGEEEAEKIAEFVKANVAEVDQRVQAATAPLMAALEQMIDSRQQTRLEGMVPDGLEDGWYEGVRESAITLGNAGKFSEMSGQARQDALFDAALRLEHPDLPSPSETKLEERRAARKRNGNTSSTGRTSRKPQKLSVKDAMQARAEAAVDGKSVEEINRLFPG